MSALWQRRLRIGVVTATVLVALLGMYALSAVFNPFLLALALAYILNPLVHGMQRRGIPRKIAIMLLFLGMFLIVVVALLVVLPRVSREAYYWCIEVTGEPFEDMNGNSRYDPRSERATWQDTNGNGICDGPDTYEDVNGNGRYDAKSERDTWNDANGNGVFDAGEMYEDLNGNGKLDLDIPADTFDDRNGNGVFDAEGEPFEDFNGNGVCDLDIPEDRWIPSKHDLNGNHHFDPGYAQRFVDWLQRKTQAEDAGASFLWRLIKPVATERMLDEAMASAKENLASLFSTTGAVAAHAWASGLRGVSWLWRVALLIVLTPIYLAFLLYSLDDIWTVTARYLPGRIRPRVVGILHEIDLVISAFFRGRLLVCLAIGVFTAIGFAICQVKFGVLFGIVIGIFSFIPFLNVLGFIPALISCWMDGFGAGGYMAVIVVYAVGQGLDPLLTSLVLGKDLQLHPVTILLSLFACSALLGFFGMLLAVPLVATAKILAKEFLLPSLEALARESTEEDKESDGPPIGGTQSL